ncbi:MAG TPA: glycosyl hydrolase, partial [Thermoanaerobaculia bacterium]|nr:glycosyl hydrolase [Thermoanaerobaculia bacterium]
MKKLVRLVCALAAAAPLAAAPNPFSGFVPRSIGPAMTGGRVIAFAVDPENSDRFYAGLASGGVWKTVNDGVTWTPVFEHEPVYSIGALAVDPKDPSVVWAGTGEGNSTRSVSWGDGVYKSVDGGKSWKNVGLKSSERIGRIAIDPRDSNVVWVAAEGSLWGPNPERGVYRTEDGGKTWKNVLFVSDHTGVADVALDPEHPDVVYASSYQRERRVYSFIGGGPESAIWKSTDGGKTWNKIMNGIPKRDLGRIGLSVSPADPRVVYASVEASEKKGGVFRSLDGGATWEKRNDLNPTPWYYSQITADPKEAGRVYVVGEGMSVSDDGGKTFRHLEEKAKHGDTHVVWIDPKKNDHLRAGCDGGIYESYDGGETWRFTANMPVTQFYRVAFDFRKPHYYVYGGTQDNNTVGGPSGTDSVSGIVNADWFVTVGGDGFFAQVDQKDPTTFYSEYQYGGLVRYDTRTGGKIGIVPQPAP